MLVLGPRGNDRKYTTDKANISNPKVNRGSPLLTTNRTSADREENTPAPLVQYIPLGVYHTGGFNVMNYIHSGIWDVISHSCHTLSGIII